MSRNNNQNRNQIATIEPPRMKMPANVAEDYALTEDSWRALVSAVFPSAETVGAVSMALAYCKRHKLDVFQRVVHIVPMWTGGRKIETVWPGIGLLRTIAHRQPEFAGYDECVFGPMIENAKFKGKSKGQGGSTYDVDATISYPEWAQFTVYKFLNGQRIKLVGPKVYWREAFSNKATAAGECPNEMWQKRPIGQLEKCAEAAALRRAFPDVLGNEYAMEEMEGRDWGDKAIEGQYVEVEERSEQKSVSKQRPRQQDYQQEQRPREEQREVRQEDHSPRQQEEPREEKPTRPPGWTEETAMLEADDQPSDAQGWAYFTELLRKRLEQLHTEEHINQLQDAQQWRIDAAPPGTQTEALELFADAIARIEPQPEDDKGNNTDGGNSEETSN